MTDTGNTAHLYDLYEVTTFHPDDKVFPLWISYFDLGEEALAHQQYSEYVLGKQSVIKLVQDINIEETTDSQWELN